MNLTRVGGHRPHEPGFGHHLPRAPPWPPAPRDLHGHLHHHPGRRGRRLDHQHGDRPPGTPTGTRPPSPAPSSVTIPAVQNPAIAHRQVGQHHRLLGRRHRRDLQLPGDQHRQRDPRLGHRHRPDGRPVGHQLSGSTTLAPNASETCTATYTTTQADVDAGSITTPAPPPAPRRPGPRSPPRPRLTIPATQTPAITMVKSASISSFSAAGHGGHLQLPGDQHRQRDPHARSASPTRCPASRPSAAPSTTLAPGATETCTATYTTTQADVDAGSITQHRHGHRHPADRPDVDRPRPR